MAAAHLNAGLHVDHFALALRKQLNDAADVCLRHLHHGLLIRLTALAINLTSDNLGVL